MKTDITPRWLADPHHDRYSRSKAHEIRIAGAIGGRRLPNSGAVRTSKWDPDRSQGGDIDHPHYFVEHKRTTTGKFSLKRMWLEKLVEGARRRGKVPVLILTFESRYAPPQDVVLLKVGDLQALVGTRVFASDGGK